MPKLQWNDYEKNMDYNVKFSQQALDDLDNIIDYISDELCNPQAAARFFNKVNQKVVLLGKNPYVYPIHHNEELSAKGLRFVVIGNYLMFYLIDEDNSIVNIVRIIYGGRNLPILFDEMNNEPGE